MAPLDRPAKRNNMGLGVIGTSKVIIKRKFRWTFKVDNICQNGAGTTSVPEHYVKLASRPNVTFESTEINFLHGRDWLPGKATLETLSVTYYDITNLDGDDNAPLWQWIVNVYNITDPTTLSMGSARSDYTGTGHLYLYDGCGNVVEQWQLNGMWPESVNFGDLDMASSDDVNIELTLRYNSVQYTPYCSPRKEFSPCCNGCP